MSGVTTGLQTAAVVWAAAMARACWQGALAFALVWMVIRLLPQLPGGLRCGLWRLAFLKLLVTLFWAQPLALPVLPARPIAAAGPAVVAAAPVPEPAASPYTPFGTLERMGSQRRPTALSSATPAGAQPRRNDRSPPAPAGHLPAMAPLFWIWLIGVAGCGARLAHQWGRVRRLRQALVPVEDEGLSRVIAELSSQLGLRRPPALAVGPVATPALIGMRRPAILLPEALRSEATPKELRLVIAHELAHLQRRDLVWGWLPVIGQCLFFFHPLVWLARGEHRLAQEMAADELAVRGTQASIGEYAEMLLALAARRREGRWELGAVGALASVTTLERRLTLLSHLTSRPCDRALRLGALATCLAAVGLAPWCVTAQSAPSSRPKLATPSRSTRSVAVVAPASPRTTAVLPTPAGVPTAKTAAAATPTPVPAAATAPVLAAEPAATPAPDARPAVPNTDPTGAIWEDMLLLEATRYLRLTDAQLRQLFAVAQSADGRLTQLRAQEDQSLASLHQIALRQREALLAGRNSSAREQASALTLRQSMQQRRAETETAIVQEVLPQLARLLAPAQVERAFLLAQGQVPPGEAAEPALLDPAAGFVTGDKSRAPSVLTMLGGKIAQGGAPGAPAPAGSLARQLLSAQQRMTDMQRGLMKLNMAGDNGGFFVAADRVEVRLPDGAAAANPEEAAKLKKTMVFAVAPDGAAAELKVRAFKEAALPEEARAKMAAEMQNTRQRMESQLQAASAEVSALRRQLFTGAPGSNGGASTEDYSTLLQPLAKRLFLSARLPAVLAERLQAAR